MQVPREDLCSKESFDSVKSFDTNTSIDDSDDLKDMNDFWEFLQRSLDQKNVFRMDLT